MSEVSGRFFWYDLNTNDTAAAQAFYTKVVGWTLSAYTSDMGEYMMWTTPNGPVGGSMMLPPGVHVPPHWLAYIGTPDVDATVQQAEALGAQVHLAPTDIPTIGRFAVLSDPQGAVFAAFTPVPGSEMAGAASGSTTLGGIGWHELMTADLEAGFAFYAALFGWDNTGEMEMGEHGTYRMFGFGQLPSLGGMMRRPKEMPVSAWSCYINVPRVHAAVATIQEAGGQVIHGPQEIPGGGHILNGIDPQGGHFALVSAPPAA
jgi:predicted enzyme related to lactoylglutathione lyase